MSPDEVSLYYFSDLDRHFGRFMEKLSGGNNPALFLAAALTSRSSREGHICLDLAGFAGQQLMPDTPDAPEETEGEKLQEMPVSHLPVCPTLSIWEEILRSSPIVGRPGEYKPLILDDKARLYLYRYWFYEDTLIRFIKNCVEPPVTDGFSEAGELEISRKELKDILHLVFPEDGSSRSSEGDVLEPSPDWQKIAALAVLQKRFTVISGSPGTGKTTTAARIIALLQQLHKGTKLRIALTAPTGKAAVRLEEAMKQALKRSNPDSQPGKAMTLHRLLGVITGSPYFRYRQGNPLPYDLVVVDEASMVDLPLMAKLVQALSPTARLILLGDRDQLASVEAGAVLGDICGPADAAHYFSKTFLEDIRKLTGDSYFMPVASGNVPPVSSSIVQLRKNYRFDESSGIGQLSKAVNLGEIDRTFSILNSSRFTDINWQALPEPQSLATALKDCFMPDFKEFMQKVKIGDDLEVLFEIFEQFRILCALRQGPFGVLAVNALLENLLRSDRLISGDGKWYPGRPVMITRNDYGLGLFNGDVGLTLPDRKGRGLSVFFRDTETGFRRFAPFRLPKHETVYAMTVHKSQGSEFNEVLFILSDRDAPLLTRELIYTGVTRAKKQLFLWGREEILSRAISRRITRISGLRDALWETGPESMS